MKLEPKSWVHELLGATVLLVIAGLLLQWAWSLFKPLLPILGMVLAIVVIARLVVAYRRHW